MRRPRHPLVEARLAGRVWTDRIARGGFALGAALVALACVSLVVFLALQVLPIFAPATVDLHSAATSLPDAVLLAGLELDDDERGLLALGADGRFYRVAGDRAPLSGSPLFSRDAIDRGRLLVDDARRVVALLTPDGGLSARRLDHDGRPGLLHEGFAPNGIDLGGPVALALSEDELVFVAQAGTGGLVVARRLFRGGAELVESLPSRVEVPLARGTRISALAIDPGSFMVYGGTTDGALFVWSPGQAAPRWSRAPAARVSALAPLPGRRALAVGQADGRVSVWYASGPETGERVLREARVFAGREAGVTAIRAREHDRTFAILDAEGGVAFANSTSGRVIWAGEGGVEGIRDVVFGAGMIALVGERDLRFGAYDLRHPELSFATLLLPIWYEGYPDAQQVWQSAGGWEGNEQKLGLTPLVFGTVKGAFYALLLAVPLGVLGALYTSHFLHPKIRAVIVPGVEMLASFPTVVLGFVAGIWLAPRLAPLVPGIAVAIVLVPLSAMWGGWLWSKRPRSMGQRAAALGELVAIGLAIALSLALSLLLSPVIERLFFGEPLPSALGAAGIGMAQRNGVLVGLAMGFAVVPLIFSVAEEAFSSVPRSLISGSLALGATSWRTVREIVLPTASPGVIAALLLGLGRALGETMIVLMASGNTPLLDPSPLTGLRALTATVALEIQDASEGGALYSVLFLASLVLLLTTFIINSAAEIVRSRLRRRLDPEGGV